MRKHSRAASEEARGGETARLVLELVRQPSPLELDQARALSAQLKKEQR